MHPNCMLRSDFCSKNFHCDPETRKNHTIFRSDMQEISQRDPFLRFQDAPPSPEFYSPLFACQSRRALAHRMRNRREGKIDGYIKKHRLRAQRDQSHLPTRKGFPCFLGESPRGFPLYATVTGNGRFLGSCRLFCFLPEPKLLSHRDSVSK